MNSQVAKVKDAIDLAALIGEHVKLTKSGKNYRGLCPFHGEKSPSFFVNPDLQRYMCFGCQEHGDCFSFLEKYDNMTFAESLRYLAKRAGIELESYVPSPEDAKRERILAILSLSKEYYSYLLTHHPVGKVALEYCLNRGINTTTLDIFGLGFSMDSWDGLQRYLIGKKKYSSQDLFDAGLTVQGPRDYYDRFRGRLMFPLTNSRGQVVGFSGRLLNKNAKEAKYINSPETTLYHKSELLFGYSQLHRFISQNDEAIVMEGEFDVMSSFQAHVQNIVAIKGSALTAQQLKTLTRSAKRIIFALDSDAAGIKATKRAIDLAKDLDVSLRVIPLVGGKDPDELAQADPGLWREMIKKSVSVYDFLIEQSFSSHDVTDGQGKKEISKELSPLIFNMTNAVEQAHYVQKIAKRLQVKEEVFLAEVRKVPISTSVTANEVTSNKVQKTSNRVDVLTEYLLGLVFHEEGEVFKTHIESILSSGVVKGTYLRLVEYATPLKDHFIIQSYMSSLPEELKDFFSLLYLRFQEQGGEQQQIEFEKAFSELEQLSKKDKLAETAKRIGELESLPSMSQSQEKELRTLVINMQK